MTADEDHEADGDSLASDGGNEKLRAVAQDDMMGGDNFASASLVLGGRRDCLSSVVV